MKAYADTSFLISLYTPDVHSVGAANSMRRSKAVFLLSAFGELELTNALELRVFRKEILRSQAEAALAAFQEDVRGGILVSKPMPPAVWPRATQLVRKYTASLGVRTLDVLHVAVALVLQADEFYTFDNRQKRLAKAAGLRTH